MPGVCYLTRSVTLKRLFETIKNTTPKPIRDLLFEKKLLKDVRLC